MSKIVSLCCNLVSLWSFCITKSLYFNKIITFQHVLAVQRSQLTLFAEFISTLPLCGPKVIPNTISQSAKCSQEIIHCVDIFGTHLPFSISCIGLTKGVLKGNNFGHLKIGGLQVVVFLFLTLIDRRSCHGELAFLDSS